MCTVLSHHACVRSSASSLVSSAPLWCACEIVMINNLGCAEYHRTEGARGRKEGTSHDPSPSPFCLKVFGLAQFLFSRTWRLGRCLHCSVSPWCSSQFLCDFAPFFSAKRAAYHQQFFGGRDHTVCLSAHLPVVKRVLRHGTCMAGCLLYQGGVVPKVINVAVAMFKRCTPFSFVTHRIHALGAGSPHFRHHCL